MRHKKERSRGLVAVRSLTENPSSRMAIALVVAAAIVLAILVLMPGLARAEPPALTGFTPGTFEGGSDVAPSGQYFFPGGWKEPPKNSTVAVGEGFPQITAKIRCTVKVTGGAVNLACPGLEKSVKGRWNGAVGLVAWPETVVGYEGPVTKLGVFAYFETVSVNGHVYHSSVSGSPKGHEREMVLQVEPGGNVEATFEVQFVHKDVKKS